MIDEIFIRDLGVIGEARLPLGPGFTAITGETGAGKTMVVTALGLLLGDRSDSAVLRHGSGSAVVEGRWLVDPGGAVAERVRDAGGDLDDCELILARSVSREGRSRATVGGRTAPVNVLTEIGEQLVVVHGQSDQVRLRSATAQREALDRFGGTAISAVLEDYRANHRCWTDDQSELEAIIAEQESREREAVELRAAMAEIESVAPRPGEDLELTELAERLTNLEILRLAAFEAHELVASDDPVDSGDVRGLLESARRQIERVAGHDATLRPIVEALANASYQVADVSALLSSYLGGLDTDSARELEIVQGRRFELGEISRKYGPTLADAIQRLESGSRRLLELDQDSDRIETLALKVQAASVRVDLLATELSRVRREFARSLGERVTEELVALAMPNARLSVEVTDRGRYGASGRDAVAILLAPHQGAEPRLLARGASGGELSRVMLAIEVVIAGNYPVPTFVFDEVDAGVGGASAIEIGRRLARLSSSAQVIVVTHLAQVAAFATNHLRVVKESDGVVIASSVQQLTGEERVEEMARLLSGLSGSQTGLQHARELLETAHSLR